MVDAKLRSALPFRATVPLCEIPVVATVAVLTRPEVPPAKRDSAIAATPHFSDFPTATMSALRLGALVLLLAAAASAQVMYARQTLPSGPRNTTVLTSELVIVAAAAVGDLVRLAPPQPYPPLCFTFSYRTDLLSVTANRLPPR